MFSIVCKSARLLQEDDMDELISAIALEWSDLEPAMLYVNSVQNGLTAREELLYKKLLTELQWKPYHVD